MNYLSLRQGWLLLIAALPAAACILVQPLDNAAPASEDDDSSSSAGAGPDHAGATGSAGKSSGSSGATGSAGHGDAGATGSAGHGSSGATGSAGHGSSGATGSAGHASGGATGSSGATGSAGRGGSGAGGAPATDTSRFLGDWVVSEGTIVFVCPNGTKSTDATGYLETWEVGTTSALVQPGFEGTCPMKANISGSTASAVPGQGCVANGTADNGDSITQTLTFTSYKFVLDAAGQTATETYSGTDFMQDNTTGQSQTCTYGRNAKFVKDEGS